MAIHLPFDGWSLSSAGWLFFYLILISCASSTSLRHGHHRHRHLGAAPMAGAQRQRKHPGLLPVLQRGRKTKLENCQQQAHCQQQVMWTYIKICCSHWLQRKKNNPELYLSSSDSQSMASRPERSMCSGWNLWAVQETATIQMRPNLSSSNQPFVSPKILNKKYF